MANHAHSIENARPQDGEPTHVDRRLFFASGTAAAVFGALRTAQAAPAAVHADDADVYAAVARLTELKTAEEAARVQMNAIARAADQDSAAFDAAVAATTDAQDEVLALRPRTLAGLRAAMLALDDSLTFEGEELLESFATFILESPALGWED